MHLYEKVNSIKKNNIYISLLIIWQPDSVSPNMKKIQGIFLLLQEYEMSSRALYILYFHIFSLEYFSRLLLERIFF